MVSESVVGGIDHNGIAHWGRVRLRSCAGGEGAWCSGLDTSGLGVVVGERDESDGEFVTCDLPTFSPLEWVGLVC